MRKDIYCNCEAPCIHKRVELKKIKIWDKGKVHKAKLQVCMCKRQNCACPYRATIDRAFQY